ncbi:GNAT family N-acetyltransferase [Hyalangium versicolor]|uniref:GNAT family N-acetyltransferase n=1 Tax=Hyalangium versicolor TaxID=2861190 RepID=UPI001CC93B8B|nr:GNAT family N-acetyltransferase [Hyalangium versicolor]
MTLTVRPARPADADALGRMGGALMRQHHDFDSQRFMLTEDVESGYRWWLAKEMKAREAVVLVAERDGEVVGYVYGRVEERDWNALRDRCGGFHDIWVDESARGSGAGRLLAEALVRRFTELGVPRVILMTAAKNEGAQKFFARLGWRPTMVEMTRETPGSGSL